MVFDQRYLMIMKSRWEILPPALSFIFLANAVPSEHTTAHNVDLLNLLYPMVNDYK